MLSPDDIPERSRREALPARSHVRPSGPSRRAATHSRLAAALLLCGPLALAGCRSEECATNADCGAGRICEAEACVAAPASSACASGADCAAGLVCEAGKCAQPTGEACSPRCEGATPVCDVAARVCVGCLRAEDCGGAAPFCDAATRSCTACPATGCVAPLKVAGARSTSRTEVEVDFDRPVAPAGVAGDGSQFGFSGGLTASAAVATGRTVRVVTGAQTPGATYTVTVAGVLAADGGAVGSTDNRAEFTAPMAAARLVLTEINPNIPQSHDLVEFLVVEAGTAKQLQVIEEGKLDDPLVLATFPDVAMQAGDVVVLHLNPAGADAPKASERRSKNESTAAGAFPDAWDFVGGSAAVTFSHRVVKVVGPDGTVQDAVAFAKVGLEGAPPGGFVQAVADLQRDGQWSPADCAGARCEYDSTPGVLDISVNWAAVGNTRQSSLSRIPGADTNSAADWVLQTGGASFGSVNR